MLTNGFEMCIFANCAGSTPATDWLVETESGFTSKSAGKGLGALTSIPTEGGAFCASLVEGSGEKTSGGFIAATGLKGGMPLKGAVGKLRMGIRCK